MEDNQEKYLSCAISGRYHICDIDLEELIEAHPRKLLAINAARNWAHFRKHHVSIYDVMTKRQWEVTSGGSYVRRVN